MKKKKERQYKGVVGAIRWLSAFRGWNFSFQESFKYDSQAQDVERAATTLRFTELNSSFNSGLSQAGRGTIGFLYRKSAVGKIFSGDCWSIRLESGRLVNTRKGSDAEYDECFIRSGEAPVAIVFDSNQFPTNSPELEILGGWSRLVKLPLVSMYDSQKFLKVVERRPKLKDRF